MALMSPFKLLCAVGLLAIFSSTISKNPSLPLLVTHLGGSQAGVGMVAGISALTGILFSFPAGLLSDRIGRRRMLLLSGAVFATAPFFYLLASNVWQLGVIRFYHGLATAVFGPVAMACVADLYQGARGEKMGWFSTATLVGRFSAPAAGGAILGIYATGDALGYTALYTVCGLAGFAAFGAMFLLPGKDRHGTTPPHSKNSLHPPEKGLGQGIKELLTNPAIMATCTVEAAILFAYGIFETFLPLRGASAGLSALEIGICISSQIITIAVSKPVLGKFSDRHGRPPQILAGVFLAAAAMAVLAVSFSFLPLICASVFFGLAIAVVTSASAAYIADLCKTGCHGSAMGLLGSIMDIGHTAGPVVGGLVAMSLGLTGSFFSGCLVLVTGGLCFLGFRRKSW